MNRFWKFWKTYILVPSIPISILTAIITICMLDSKSWIPTALCVSSLLWLLAIIIVNDRERDEKHGETKNRHNKSDVWETDSD